MKSVPMMVATPDRMMQMTTITKYHLYPAIM